MYLTLFTEEHTFVLLLYINDIFSEVTCGNKEPIKEEQSTKNDLLRKHQKTNRRDKESPKKSQN